MEPLESLFDGVRRNNLWINICEVETFKDESRFFKANPMLFEVCLVFICVPLEFYNTVSIYFK